MFFQADQIDSVSNTCKIKKSTSAKDIANFKLPLIVFLLRFHAMAFHFNNENNKKKTIKLTRFQVSAQAERTKIFFNTQVIK